MELSNFSEKTIAIMVASGRASAPARNNHRSIGDADGRDTSLGSEFSRSHTLFISIQKNYEKHQNRPFAKDAG